MFRSPNGNQMTGRATPSINWNMPSVPPERGRRRTGRVSILYLTCMLFWSGTPWVGAAAAFAAFRVFDVAKPPPIRRIERLPGGWGVMADDLAAALYAAACLWLVAAFAGAGGTA